MFNYSRPIEPVQGDARGFGNHVREILAYIVSPIGRRSPSIGDIRRLLCNALDWYHAGVVALAEAAVAMFGTKGIGEPVVPGSYPLEDVRGTDGIPGEAGPGGSARDTIVISALEGPGPSGVKFKSECEDHVSGSHERVVELADGYPARGLTPPVSSVGTTETDSSLVDSPTVDHSLVVKLPVPNGFKPIASLVGLRNISSQQTLRVPGVGPPRSLPKLVYLETRSFRYEQEVAKSPELQYTACELADRGIFLRRPVDDVKFSGAYLSKARLHREMAIGPLKRRWRWKGMAKGVPMIVVSGPDSPETTLASSANCRLASTVGHTVPTASTPPAPSHVGTRRTRNRSNALRMPSQSTSSSCPTEPTTPAPILPSVAPVQELLPPAQPHTSSAPATISVDASPAQVARRMRGRPTSMTEWLTQFSTGNNPLVNQSIVANASPVLQTALASSPPSSPESSPPCTPVIDATSLPRVVVAEAVEAVEPGDGRRRRARCSYDGGKCDAVVAPVIPEELLTDEIGVAC